LTAVLKNIIEDYISYAIKLKSENESLKKQLTERE
jgi:hypothetical protein